MNDQTEGRRPARQGDAAVLFVAAIFAAQGRSTDDPAAFLKRAETFVEKAEEYLDVEFR